MTEFTPLASFGGGALLGLSAVVFLLFTGRAAGVSGIVRSLFPGHHGKDGLTSLGFLAGLLAAAPLWQLVTNSPVVQTVTSNSTLALTAGLLVGLGSVLAGGCTSGHGICGLSRVQARSLVAVGVFMATAAATVYLVKHVLGGWPWG